jgi:hypothetical protein
MLTQLRTPPDWTRERPAGPWTVFALIIAAQVMVILDVSVVSVALPSISRGHGHGPHH